MLLKYIVCVIVSILKTLPMQYTEIFKVVKKITTISVVFFFFFYFSFVCSIHRLWVHVRNGEAVLTSTHPTIYVLEQK